MRVQTNRMCPAIDKTKTCLCGWTQIVNCRIPPGSREYASPGISAFRCRVRCARGQDCCLLRYIASEIPHGIFIAGPTMQHEQEMSRYPLPRTVPEHPVPEFVDFSISLGWHV